MRSSVWVTSGRQTPSLRGGPSTNYPIRRRFSCTPGAMPSAHVPSDPKRQSTVDSRLCGIIAQESPRDLLAFSASRKEKEQTTAYFLSCLRPLASNPAQIVQSLSNACSHLPGPTPLVVGPSRERSGRAFASLEGVSGVNHCFSRLLPMSSP